jgi:hypothetical protein
MGVVIAMIDSWSLSANKNVCFKKKIPYFKKSDTLWWPQKEKNMGVVTVKIDSLALSANKNVCFKKKIGHQKKIGHHKNNRTLYGDRKPRQWVW